METKNIKEKGLGVYAIMNKKVYVGETNPSMKYTDALLIEAINYSFQGMIAKDVADKFDIPRNTYSRIVQGVSRRYIHAKYIQPRIDKGEKTTIQSPKYEYRKQKPIVPYYLE